jgi:hypothetical protein
MEKRYTIKRKVVECEVIVILSLDEVKALANALENVAYVHCRQHTHTERELLDTFNNIRKEVDPL